MGIARDLVPLTYHGEPMAMSATIYLGSEERKMEIGSAVCQDRQRASAIL